MIARLRALLAHPAIETAVAVALAAAAVGKLTKLVDRRAKELHSMDVELLTLHDRWDREQAARLAELDAELSRRLAAAGADADADVDQAAADYAAAADQP